MLSQNSLLTSTFWLPLALMRALERAPDQMVKRDRAAAMRQKVEGAGGPHEGIFKALRVPEIAAHTPALEIGYKKEQEHRQCGGAREEAERQQGPGNELRAGDERRPYLAGPIPPFVERLRHHRQ